MDALKIDRAVLGGFDWGARTADIVAALWPQSGQGAGVGERLPDRQSRCQSTAFVARRPSTAGGTSTTSRPIAGFAATARTPTTSTSSSGRTASPTWKFDDATYDRTAAAFTNPDHVDIVIHNYRWRLGLAPGEPQYDDLDRKLAASPPITVPTITIGSDFDGPEQGRRRLPQDVHRPVLAPRPRRHRAQRAAGGAASVRRCRRRRRQSVARPWVVVCHRRLRTSHVDELITALTRGSRGSPCRRSAYAVVA